MFITVAVSEPDNWRLLGPTTCSIIRLLYSIIRVRSLDGLLEQQSNTAAKSVKLLQST